jgi:UDP-N-acetylglucosamine acyltransferase
MSSSTLISPHAVVHPDAVIGEDVRIDPFVVVEADVVVGRGTHVGAHAHLCSGARIGEECVIFTGASIGAVPQDLKFSGEETEAIVGDRTVIREYVTIHRGTSATKKTIVGSDVLLMAYTHVAHDCRVGDRVILANGVQLGGHVEVGEWVIIGGLTGVHQFERIGRHAMVGAGFRVMKDVPPYALAGNEPIGFSGINAVGLKRRGFSTEEIDHIRSLYRVIYRSGLNVADALDRMHGEHPDDAVALEISDFISSSKRGIMPLSR